MLPVLRSLEGQKKHKDQVELIFVEDACPEESGRATAELWRSGHLPDNLVLRILRLSSHRGQQSAVLCGLEAASGEWVITMDDDTQHPPEFIHALLEYRNKDVDLVYALPKGARSAGSLGRDRLFRFLLKLPEGIGVGSFRLIRGSLLEGIRGKGKGFVYVSAMLLKVNREMRIWNCFYPVVGTRNLSGGGGEPGTRNGAARALVGNGAGSETVSRIPLMARMSLIIKLTLKYGLFRGRSLPWTGPAYRIREEL